MDETFVRTAGKWKYLFRAVDSHGQTVDFYLSERRDRKAAKLFLEKALANPTTGSRTSSPVMACAVIQPQSGSKPRVACRAVAASERAATVIIGSNPITVTSSAGCA